MYNLFNLIHFIELLFSLLIIIIIIMNFYSPVSNTKCHSIGHKMRIARIKIRVDSPGRWGIRSLGRECNFEEVCFELGTEYWQRRRVSSIRRE